MNKKQMSYSLENLWNANNLQIQQILQYFNYPISNSPNDKLSAVILSFNNNILIPEERYYVSNPDFNRLFLSSSNMNEIKRIIDNTKIIINENLYQMGNKLYLCGPNTYNLRDKLKELKGIWNPSLKCWILHLETKEELISLITRIQNVNSIPLIIPNNLEIYQYNNQIAVCGSKTYELQNKLRLIGKFDSRLGCWIIPNDKYNVALEIVNQARQTIPSTRPEINQEEVARLYREYVPPKTSINISSEGY